MLAGLFALIGLLEDVDAVGISLDHALHAAHVAFDALEPVD